MIRNSNNTSDNILRWIALGCELVMLNIALGITYYAYWKTALLVPPHYKRLMLLMTLVYTLCSIQQERNIHSRFIRHDELLKNLLTTLGGFTFLSALVLWVFRWPLLNWKYMVPFYLCIWLFISLYRWGVRQAIKLYRKRGGNSMRIAFVGDVSLAQALYMRMKEAETGLKLAGYFADSPIEGFPQEDYLGKPEDVPQKIMEGQPSLHALYCMLPAHREELTKQIISACEQRVVRYNHIPPSFNYQRYNIAFTQQEGVPVLKIHNEPLSYLGNRILKRSFDFVASTLFLVFVFPFVLLIFGTAIKLSSPGPIFFKQRRSGLEGKEFWCWKFRSMKVNKDSDKVQATKDDPRTTWVGKLMRKTNVDELPQFINVWRGDMSIVGPRPHMVAHTEQYSELIKQYMVRHLAKPGITGWAQVTGFRGETKELWQMEGRVERDIWYIEHWSFSLDISIILRTIRNTIQGEKNAY